MTGLLLICVFLQIQTVLGLWLAKRLRAKATAEREAERERDKAAFRALTVVLQQREDFLISLIHKTRGQ